MRQRLLLTGVSVQGVTPMKADLESLPDFQEAKIPDVSAARSRSLHIGRELDHHPEVF